MKTDGAVVVLVGAGFNFDAAEEAGAPDCRYPLLNDLLRACFGLTALPAGTSIEDLFAGAIQRRDRVPLERLCELLQTADYYVAENLRASSPRFKGDGSPGADDTTRDNIYLRFLRRFAPRTILTFNYDSLVELLLFSLDIWRPEDGYGLPVHAELQSGLVRPPILPDASESVVLHLHGALALYSDEFAIRPESGFRMRMLERREEPVFIFDPDANAGQFFPFVRTYPTPAFEYVDGRIIAPVPSKAEGRQEAFIQRVNARAIEAVASSQELLVIGYRFAESDAASYVPLLRAAAGKRVVVVLPEAYGLVERLSKEFPHISWSAQPTGFRAWCDRDFPMN